MVRRGLLACAGLASVAACAAVGQSLHGGPAVAEGATLSGSAAPRDIVSPPAVVATPSASSPTTLARSLPAPTACPPEMALVGAACIDRYEAHLQVAAEDGSLQTHPPQLRPVGNKFVAAAAAGVKPQAYVSQVEAANACANAGKRLCSLVEWYGACTGSPRATYPYGPRYEAGRCNVGKTHLLSLLHGRDSRRWQFSDFNDPALSTRPGFLALTGEYGGCASGSGVHDLVGNLHEWVADRVDATLASKLPLADIIERRIGRTRGNGIFMGGFYSTTNEHGAGCNFVTAAHEPRYHDYSTGFRCCRDP